MGVIDTISSGFDSVTKRLWLTAVPIALDLALWLGPKLSIAPVVEKMIALSQRIVDAAPPPGDVQASYEMFGMMADTLRNTVGKTNLLSLLAWGRLGIPSIASLVPVNGQTSRVIEISGFGQVLLLQLIIMGVGLMIACVFLRMLALEARGESMTWQSLFPGVLTYWVRMALIFIPLGGSLVFALSASLMFGPLAIFIGVGVLWMLVYTAFVPQAITLAEQRPWGALLSSLNVVRMNFWPTLGLLILTNLLGAGLSLIWGRLLVGSTIGKLVAITANAYVGTALTLALFLFYRDRLGTIRESAERQRDM